MDFQSQNLRMHTCIHFLLTTALFSSEILLRSGCLVVHQLLTIHQLVRVSVRLRVKFRVRAMDMN